MKYITFAIPCYNSEAYMEKAINSILPAGDDVEILIVNDGSTDKTKKIGKHYAEKFPSIVKVINKENGGHGDAVNSGLSHASGKYFKVVDSDDWVNEEAYQSVLTALREFAAMESSADVLVTNFVYEKQGARRKKVMNYRSAIPREELTDWSGVKMFILGQYILMHSVIYRTGLLRDCGLELPRHTFYVDNLFVYQPLPHVKSMYYLDVNFYRYFIGRDDQSVNEKVMIGRLDQQIRVTKLMLGCCDVLKLSDRKLRRYMIRYLEIMMTVSSILAIRSGTKEDLGKKRELWQYLKQSNFPLYLRLRWGFLGQGVNLPGKSGRKVSIACYKITHKFYGFN